MGIFSTLVGGTLGFLVAGPFGALLGASLGSRVETSSAQGRQRLGRLTQAEGQALFAVALTSLAAKVAKADGHVSQDEIDAYDQFLERGMGMSVEERRDAARIFNAARDSETPASDFARQVGTLLGNQPDRLRDIITMLLMIAAADGHIDQAEETMIRAIARDMGLSPGDYESCRATYNASHGGNDISPYEVLGVEPDASDADVRSAHRRLVREYHPDVLQSKGLPAEFMKFAGEKMSAINDAWSKVKKSRAL
ncbi:MAG: DnaJ like chaperone protein [Planctomycetota bacterium]|jgi:DnaJ like chaperone protein